MCHQGLCWITNGKNGLIFALWHLLVYGMASKLNVGRTSIHIVLTSIVVIVIVKIQINHHLLLSSFAKRLVMRIKNFQISLFPGVHWALEYIVTEPCQTAMQYFWLGVKMLPKNDPRPVRSWSFSEECFLEEKIRNSDEEILKWNTGKKWPPQSPCNQENPASKEKRKTTPYQ